MPSRYLLIIALLCLYTVPARAQAIDNTLSYKDINTDRYFRVCLENDVFSGTDKYYTQGITFDLVLPKLKKFFINRLLLHPVDGSTKYGLSLEQDVYTPINFVVPYIRHGDRPFSATLFLRSFATTIDSVHRQRFSAALSAGVIGPGAIGKEMQTGIHSIIGDYLPYGWVNQIHNDVILNYQVDYEKQLISIGRYLSADAGAMARVGTLSDKLNLGPTIMFGYFNSPYKVSKARKSEFRIYAYERPALNIVGYDATLQGGLIDHGSPYTISSRNICRFVFDNRFGFVAQYKRIYLEYFQSVLSQEYITGNFHVWGGVQLAFGI